MRREGKVANRVCVCVCRAYRDCKEQWVCLFGGIHGVLGGRLIGV
jgi:hypothetical protein